MSCIFELELPMCKGCTMRRDCWSCDKIGDWIRDRIDVEQHGDLISRSALMTDIMMLPHNGEIICSSEVEQAIMDAPAVEAEPVRHAMWEPYGMHMNGVVGNWRCTDCKRTSLRDDEWCPRCGAKMDARDAHG